MVQRVSCNPACTYVFTRACSCVHCWCGLRRQPGEKQMQRALNQGQAWLTESGEVEWVEGVSSRTTGSSNAFNASQHQKLKGEEFSDMKVLIDRKLDFDCGCRCVHVSVYARGGVLYHSRLLAHTRTVALRCGKTKLQTMAFTISGWGLRRTSSGSR